MECSRKNCGEIMCHTYVDDAGHVCSDCQSEFEKYIESLDMDGADDHMNEGQLKKHLITFMDTEKDYYVEGEEISVTDFFFKHTN